MAPCNPFPYLLLLLQIVKMLADAKCDVSMKDCNGMTAADVAEKAKESDIIKFLKVRLASSNFC